MSSRNYETQILDSIQMIVDNAISKASFDKTIKAIVTDATNSAEGQYTVSYQGNPLVVYSSNPDTHYSKGSEVYVLIPGNDTRQQKTIVGAVDNLGLDYNQVLEEEMRYEVVGANMINSGSTFELCSYVPNSIKTLYDKDNNINLIDFNVQSFDIYANQSDYLLCGAKFRTALPHEQQVQGEYGIAFDINYSNDEDIITKTYVVNSNNMLGTPYNLTSDTRQYSIFQVDKENILSVQRIYIFAYGFPNQGTELANDIFVSHIELQGANKINQEDLSSTVLSFITQKGTYFDSQHLNTDTLTIQAQVKIKGNVLGEGADVKYYWFREDNQITNLHYLYNRLGGAGWRCLNDYNAYQNETQNVEWVPGKSILTIQKEQNTAKETTYKCVAVYNQNTILQKEIVITNLDADYEILIASDDGTYFYHNNGKPSLTCLINNQELDSSEYAYIWSVTDNNGRMQTLNETTYDNIAYNEAVQRKEELLEEIASENKLTGEIQNELNECENTIEFYSNKTRVEKNKIHNINLKDISYVSTYKCSVFKKEVLLGTATIVITNDIVTNISYNLVIHNGNQVFKYNEAGVAPNNDSLANPIEVLPLTFTLYDKDGKEVDQSLISAQDITWTVPLQHTLIEESKVYEISKETNDFVEYYRTKEFSFNIRQTYLATHINNNIELKINYKGNIISAFTNFTFVKTGEVGTNGTDCVCKLIPNISSIADMVETPMVTYYQEDDIYVLNYQPLVENKWFTMNFWRNGELIYSGTESGYTSEGQNISLTWSILANNYGRDIKDPSNLIIDATTGEISIDTTQYEHPANIIKCQIHYNGMDYFALMPVIFTRALNQTYKIALQSQSGFKDAMYTANGLNPVYNSANPFTIQVLENINNTWEDISILEKEFSVNYEWSVKGQVYYTYWQSELNLLEKTWLISKEQKNQKYFEPADTYNGLCVTNAIECKVTRGETELGTIHIPVHLYLNRYGNAAINGWDGNSVSIDENNSGLILAPQVGAGIKNEDNSFTGIFMGSVKEQGASENEYGLFGYNAGQRTIALSAEDGSARFGATGKGQIVIDPSTGSAMIESGNFNKEAGTGMRIDLSEPSIEFGSGNFKVDKYGQLTAAGFSTIAYVDKKKEEVIQEVEGMLDQSPLKIELTTDNLFIPCNDSNIPVYKATYNIDFAGTFEGETVPIDVTYKGNGFPQKVNNITISLVDAKQQLQFSVENVGTEENIQIPTNSSYTFDFVYVNGEQSYTTKKTITVTVLPPGAPGKSAYDIWLDQGNVGTEQDYLDSLKGADASTALLETEREFTGYETQRLTNSGDHEMPLLYAYGTYEQETEHSENVLEAFAVSISNTTYWDERPSKLQVTNLEDGWGRLVLDNTSGTSTLSETIAINANYIDWEYSTNYTLVAEIRNSSMSGSNSKFYVMGGSGNGRVHMFNEGAWSLNVDKINAGGVYYSNVWETIPNRQWDSFPMALFAHAGTISTVEVRISMFKGKLDIDTENFTYIPCKYLKPSLDNPSPIKTLGYQNLLNQEDWYQTYAAVKPESIMETSYEGKKVYKMQSSGLTSVKYMEGQFKENTVYRFSFKGCQEVKSSSSTLYFQLVYTDGTTTSSYVSTGTTLADRNVTSTKGKTISYLRINVGSSSYATKWVYITDLSITEGAKRQEYIPHGKYGLDLAINGKNLINIFTLTPNKTLNKLTGQEEDSSSHVISPFIRLESVSYLQARYSRIFYLYYDKNFNYLGCGEKLNKTGSVTGQTTNVVPYELNSSIYYVRMNYISDWSSNPTEDLIEALESYDLNSSYFVVIGEKSITEKLITNCESGQYLKHHTIVLDQPLSRVSHSHTPEKSTVKDTVAIEDGIVQISYNTHYIVWNGTEEGWNLEAETDNYIAFSMIDPYDIAWSSSNKAIISSHFAPGARLWNTDINGKAIEDLWVKGDYIGIQIAKSRLTSNTVEGFKEWLSNNPITIIADREQTETKTLLEGCDLRTFKNVSHLFLENNTINPEVTGVYYTTFKGSSGDSIICKITPSSQMFKSVDGPNGPFTPNEILLFPEIFNTYFKAWYYSVDSINWEPVVSGEHGLEVGTFSEKENTLKISNDCDLYTEEDTTVSFKCTTYNDSVYDVSTIAKSYDLVDLTVGGRNFILKSHIFDDLKEWGEEAVQDKDANGKVTKTWYLTEVRENGVLKYDGQPAEYIGVVVGEDTAGEDFVQINAQEGNGGRVHWIHSNTADVYLQDGDQFVFSCEIEGVGLESHNPPLFHYHGTVGYVSMDGEVTEEPSRITCSGTWKKVDGYNTDFRFDFTGLVGSYKLRKFKLEKGKNPTDWTLAPEDLETIAELEYCIGKSSTEPPAEDHPSWGAQTRFNPNLNDGDYLWSRIKNISTSGLITYNSYSCLLFYQKELKSQRTEYLLCNVVDENVILKYKDSEAWTTTKPTDFLWENASVVASKLWSRQHLIYLSVVDGSAVETHMYTNYTLDTAWEKSLIVETELTGKINNIISNTNEGFVRIEGGNIVIGNDPKKPEHLIILNHYGISFLHREGATDWPSAGEIETATKGTTAWTIDGSLDMNYIRTEELEATYIRNENLILGNKDNRVINDQMETVDAGDLDIYDKNGNLIFETVTSAKTGSSETAVWIEGFKIHQYVVSDDWTTWTKTGYIYLSAENGFGEFDVKNKLIYGKQNGVWFARIAETEKQVIATTDSSNTKYGVQMIPMSFTENGIKHKGLAFLRVDAED